MHEAKKTTVTTYKVLKQKIRLFDCC